MFELKGAIQDGVFSILPIVLLADSEKGFPYWRISVRFQAPP